jgi:hypothetical protein
VGFRVSLDAEGARRDSRHGSEGAARERGEEGNRSVVFIYQWQLRVNMLKFVGEVNNPSPQKLGKLLPPSFWTLGKNELLGLVAGGKIRFVWRSL